MPTRYAALLVMIMMALSVGACSSLTGGSEVADLETQNAQLQSTIQMVGTPLLTIAALEQQATQNVVFQAQVTQLAVQLLSSQATLTVLELSGGGAVAVQQPTPQPQSPIVSNNNNNAAPQATLPAANPAITPSPAAAGDTTNSSGTQFTQTVTSTGRDNQDCAVGVTSTFSPSTDTIYVVTRINTLTAGSVIGARWTVDGEVYLDDTECWIPTRNYANICAYCSVVPDGAIFQSGQWTVELTLNSQLLSQVQFVVTGSSVSDETDTTTEDMSETDTTTDG
ncbi:MAG: hypothetical protein JXA10_03475 [Anaerolineae bacterium]|nr:hypothetical protein [Anaerolineae bacterium]